MYTVIETKPPILFRKSWSLSLIVDKHSIKVDELYRHCKMRKESELIDENDIGVR